jgi:hypothetical protein
MSRLLQGQDAPELQAFHRANAVQQQARRILETAARKGGARIGASRPKQAGKVMSFKAGDAHIVQAFRKGDALVVSYLIEGRTHRVTLEPGDPRHDPEQFKAWLEKETTARVLAARRAQASRILKGPRT